MDMAATVERVRLDADHRYWIPCGSGEGLVPGFTEICVDLGIIEPNRFHTEAGREEGKAIHSWCLFLAQGHEPCEDPDERIAGRLAGFRKFLSDSSFKFVGGEEPLYHPDLRYACTPDLIGHLGAFSVVIDVKRGAKEKWHPLQTAAQSLATFVNGFQAQKRYSLYLKDHDFRLEEHADRSDFERWKAIVAAYHAKSFYRKGGK